jgi:hypothetical protein
MDAPHDNLRALAAVLADVETYRRILNTEARIHAALLGQFTAKPDLDVSRSLAASARLLERKQNAFARAVLHFEMGFVINYWELRLAGEAETMGPARDKWNAYRESEFFKQALALGFDERQFLFLSATEIRLKEKAFV